MAFSSPCKQNSQRLKEEVTPLGVRIIFVSPIKSLYWVKLLTEVLASKVHFYTEKFVSKEAGIGSCHFETNAQRPGRARLLLAWCHLDQEILSWQGYLFTGGHGWSSTLPFWARTCSYPEHSESENEEVNNWLEGTLWFSCERCQIMPMQRECVCCQEQPEEETKFKVEF